MQNYYPQYAGLTPIHPVTSWAKVRRLVRAARRGHEITPILIEGDLGNGSLLTGTHRAAANDLLEMLGDNCLIECVSIDEIDASDDLREAAANNDYETLDALWDR